MTDTTGTRSGSGATPPASPQPPPVSVALQLGWVMMVLFGPFAPYDPTGTGVTDRLPTEHELQKPERIAVELTRLACLVKELNGQTKVPVSLPPPDSAGLAATSSTQLVDDITRRGALLTYNAGLIEGLACADRQLGLAYQAGRSLRITANPLSSSDPSDAVFLAGVARNLRRERTVRIQSWLSVLTAALPNESGTIVNASLGRWSDWGTTVLDESGNARLRQPDAVHTYAGQVRSTLLEQGDAWLNLLTGTQATAGLLTPESYVAAGEAALSRTTRIVRKVVEHNWVSLVVLAVALAVVLYTSFRYLEGAAKVWTTIASIAGALGITAKGISSSVVRLSSAAERPIYHAEELDAMAWAVTTLPPEGPVAPAATRELRRLGIQPAAPLGRS